MQKLNYSKRQRESVKLWLELSRSANELEAIMDSNLRANFGQSMSRFDVLSQLDRTDENGLTIGDLAGQLIASKGNITGLLTRMESDGLVERRAIPGDRRSTQVVITSKGRALFQKMALEHANWSETALSGLNAKDIQSLLDLLKKTRHVISETA